MSDATASTDADEADEEDTAPEERPGATVAREWSANSDAITATSTDDETLAAAQPVIGELARQVLTTDFDPWSWIVQLAEKHDDLDEDTVRQRVTNRCETLRPTLDEGTIAPEQVFRALAGIPPTLAIPDASLTDRELAHHTWRYVAQQPDHHIRVRDEDESLWVYDDGIWVQEGVQTLRTVSCDLLATAYGQNIRTELVERVRGDPTVRLAPDAFGVPTGMVAVENGLLDLDAAADGAGEDARRDLRPDDYALTRLPVAHDPTAPYDEWAGYVDEWAEDGKADALQEYAGYCLHVGTLPIHRALLLVGAGANGKSVFLHVIRELLGPENTTSIELQTLANEQNAVADFYGSLANIDDDLSARKLGNGLGMFKKLTGDNRVTGRQLYESAFEFDAVGKHLYAANEVPDVSDDVDDDDEAFWRRWLLVEFPNHYPPTQRDTDLPDALTEPDVLSGVLNWAIEGRARLLDQGHFTNEERYAQAKRERWQAWGDSVNTFISECVERDPDAERLTTAQAHQRYVAWCRENGHDPVGQQQFTSTVKHEDVGYKTSIRIDGRNERGYDALGLSDEVPDPERTDSDHGGRQDSLV